MGLVAAAFLIGLVLGATLLGTINFPYQIGPSSGGATMTPSNIQVDLGTLAPGSSGSGSRAKGLTQIAVTVSPVSISHVLGGDLAVFDSFSVWLYYWDTTSGVMEVTIFVYLSDPSETWNVPVGTYDLSLSYSYTVKSDAAVGTTGTVKVEFSLS